MSDNDSILGCGWSFPPAFDRDVAGVRMSEGVEDINQSLHIIFSTALGERVMNPTFGCAMDEMVFETMNASLIGYLENLVKTAILYHEPRIDADAVTVEPDQNEGVLWITIEYTVRTTNSRFNFVYPFYLDRATG